MVDFSPYAGDCESFSLPSLRRVSPPLLVLATDDTISSSFSFFDSQTLERSFTTTPSWPLGLKSRSVSLKESLAVRLPLPLVRSRPVSELFSYSFFFFLGGDTTDVRNYGAKVTANTFGGTHLTFGLAVAGVKDWGLSDNVALASTRFQGG